MKTKEKKTQKIKGIALKIVHILSYILSALFLVVCIVAGVKSCDNKQKGDTPQKQRNNAVVAEDNSDYADNFLNFKYLYTMKYNEGDVVDFSENQMALYMNRFGYSDIEYSSPQPSTFRYFTFTNYEVYIYENETFYPVEQIRFQLICENEIDAQPSYYKYQLNTIEFYYNEGFHYGIKPYSFLESPVVYSFEVQKWNLFITSVLPVSDDLFTEGFLDYWAIRRELSNATFTFNESINYNAPFGYLGKNPLIPRSKWMSSLTQLDGSGSGGSYYGVIDTCWFSVNGKLYNQIELIGQDAYNYYYHFGDSVVQYTLDHDLVFVEFIAYRNSFLEDFDYVWARDITIDYQSNKYILEDSGHWLNNSNRQLVLLDYTSDYEQAFTQFNTDLDLYGGGIEFGGTEDVGIGGAFDLLGRAFTSLLGLMSIQVLPGLTLGLFIFLPLVATIIILVFKAVKK